jgi:rSAM/selenodomain-associated transferase 2
MGTFSEGMKYTETAKSSPLFSVVIPALNESEHILKALESVNEQGEPLEIIVVDGGSTDDTLAKAKRFGAAAISTRKGRGYQISEGLKICKGDMVLILHADCCLRSGILKIIRERMDKNPFCVGGALGMAYRSISVKNHVLSWFNNVRAKRFGIAFGDQGQFFRKAVLEQMGGFPEQMLMEDVELSMRLKRKGSVCFVPNGIQVSERRWKRVGLWRNTITVVALCLRYLVQRRFGLSDTTLASYYRQYYGQRP